jgi:hypothetical protein
MYFDGSTRSGTAIIHTMSTPGRPVYFMSGTKSWVLGISTLEGEMRAVAGNYIIHGIKGEVYPCDGDIFRATYEPFQPTPDNKTPYRSPNHIFPFDTFGPVRIHTRGDL